jgi:hypothetical protein
MAESASNDIALMEVVVGLFGRLEFITSGIAAFTKAREFVRLAQTVVAKAHGDNVSGMWMSCLRTLQLLIRFFKI